ncbi:MAG: hypothetical protein HXS54_18220 [Theionarchaea archaeon]|nr:hypothetical protein [Theionarchaea archaeon]
MVLFVTGVCDLCCGYCPLSEKRWQKDVVYANERLVTSDEDILEVKSAFCDHHIHLYTGSYINDEVLHSMEGLIDEIRIHLIDFSNLRPVEKILKHNFCTGVEIPMIPSRLEETKTLINRLKRKGIHFVNLNELEYADRNIAYLKNLGYSLDEDSCRVKGSEEAALELVDDEVVHYCSASDKDSLQLRNRLIRRAQNVRQPYEEIEDGLLVKGVISCKTEEEAQHIKELLLNKVDIPESYIAVRGTRIETHWALAEEASSWIKAEIGIEKRFPTFDQPLIEYIPV